MNKYKVEVNVKHVIWLFAENEEEAREKAEMKSNFEKLDKLYKKLIHF